MKCKKCEWYRKQIEGLFLIINQGEEFGIMVAREYVKEKLMMILGCGINFEPSIKGRLGIE